MSNRTPNKKLNVDENLKFQTQRNSVQTGVLPNFLTPTSRTNAGKDIKKGAVVLETDRSDEQSFVPEPSTTALTDQIKKAAGGSNKVLSVT